MDLPEWHETGLDADAVVNLKQISEMDDAPGYAALRSYSTGRREHALYGPMPTAVARISNRRIWLRADIELWLTVPIPVYHRSPQRIKGWISQGRPRIPSTACTPPESNLT